MKKSSKQNIRLSEHIIPVRYKIHFTPDLDNFVFTGEEEISLKVLKQTKKVTLHSAEIEILSASIASGKKSIPAKISYNNREETATLTFETVIRKGSARLKLSFAGILNDKMRGFYRSKYEFGGKTHHMAVTQFESTDARRAFPCFDEPAQKAVFEVSLKIPSDRTAISNTIESEITEHEGGFKTVKFAPSPKMSSYLLAFIVGHFEHIEKNTARGVNVRIFTTPGKKHQAEFALDTAVRCTEFYEKYFGIHYPLPVLDLIAIPDFASGAMENWGAVTYRDTALLVDPLHSSTRNKQYVALVIAHELAHQWFGNLVTMEWWTHLWLNEGFASYMEYVAVDNLFPKWHIWSQFVYMEQAQALELDGLSNTHAIEIDVYRPADIAEIFDAVSYSKGSSVIRMLAEYLGEKDFGRGLHGYLSKHAYANAQTSDLWKAFEKVSGKPVAEMMDGWTRRPGYPVIKIEIKNKKLYISQSRFFANSLVSGTKNPLWMVPLNIISSKKDERISFLLSKQSASVKFENGGWIKANSGETSFVRVAYSDELLEKLRMPVRNKGLSEEDRFGIVRGLFALAEAGETSTEEALSFASVFRHDDSFIVWGQLILNILKLSNLFYGKPYYDKFRAYSVDLLSGIEEKVGWIKGKHESHQTTLLRSSVIYAIGTNGSKKTIEHALQIFGESVKNKKHIEADLKSAVYNLVAENGGENEHRLFLAMHKKEKLAEEQDRILRALCSFRNKKLLSETLKFAFSKETKEQDLFRAVAFVWGNPVGRELAWDKVRTNWKEIKKRFEGGHLFPRFVSPAANFNTHEKADEVEEFFKKNPGEGISRTVAQTLEQIRSNAAWLARDSSKIESFLKAI